MAFKDWFSRKTQLQLALDRGSQPGADLEGEIHKLIDYSIESAADAEALCRALAQLVPAASNIGDRPAFRTLVGLFQDVANNDCPAFAVLQKKGNRLLARIVNDALDTPLRRDADDVLFALKILAMYGTPEGAKVVLRAARQPLRPDAYMWSVILRAYSNEHPQSEWLFKELSDPLPSDFLAVALLDSANVALRDGAEFPHPFDSPAGAVQLESWLTNSDEEHFSYAVSAAAAMPFIIASERDALLALAFDHPSAEVQLEAAWAAAKLGRDAGIKWLARSCLDVNLAERAKRYLTDLGRNDAIPAGAEDTDFRAKAEFAQWLAHPNELGRPPDELEIVDHRELSWPPDRTLKPMWLVKYRAKDVTGLKADDVGIGLVGSVTFCLFSYHLEQRPPEDSYAIHCYWEMNCRKLIAETDVPENSSEYDSLLTQFKQAGASVMRIVSVVEFSAELQYPQRLVALAKASRENQEGWVVLDGPGSRWYAASDMPKESLDKLVLMIHVGRVLLGFNDEPDRRRFLQPAAPPRPPEQIIAAYERILDKARTDPSEAKKLLGGYSVLEGAFTDYVAALSSVRGQSPAVCTCIAFEALLVAVELADRALQGESHGYLSPFGVAFDRYIGALIDLKRQTDVPALLEKLRSHWDHNLGYAKLGSAAFKAGYDEIAEKFIVKLRDSLKDWWRCEEMNFLAEIWKRKGRSEEARSLLIDSLKGLLEESHTATGSDRKLFEEWFQVRRSTYLTLFSECGDDELRRLRIPASTLDDSPN